MIELTQKQLAVLTFIREFARRYGYPPTRREICTGFKWTSDNAAQDVLLALERKGRLQITRGVSRGLKVLDEA